METKLLSIADKEFHTDVVDGITANYKPLLEFKITKEEKLLSLLVSHYGDEVDPVKVAGLKSSMGMNITNIGKPSDKHQQDAPAFLQLAIMLIAEEAGDPELANIKSLYSEYAAAVEKLNASYLNEGKLVVEQAMSLFSRLKK